MKDGNLVVVGGKVREKDGCIEDIGILYSSSSVGSAVPLKVKESDGKSVWSLVKVVELVGRTDSMFFGPFVGTSSDSFSLEALIDGCNVGRGVGYVSLNGFSDGRSAGGTVYSVCVTKLTYGDGKGEKKQYVVLS